MKRKIKMLMGSLIALPVVAGVSLVAHAQVTGTTPSALLGEFFRRDKIRMTAPKAAVIRFLTDLKVPTENIEELEIIDTEGRFVYRDRNDMVCLGNPAKVMLRCKNKMGLTTVTFEGDAD